MFTIIAFFITAFIESLLSARCCVRIIQMNLISLLDKIALTIMLIMTLWSLLKKKDVKLLQKRGRN